MPHGESNIAPNGLHLPLIMEDREVAREWPDEYFERVGVSPPPRKTPPGKNGT